MKKEMKRRMGWLVVVGIFLFTIVSLVIELISARTEVAKIRAEMATVRPAIEVAAEDKNIECYLENAVLFYNEGQKRDCFKFLDAAFDKIRDRNNRNFMTLTEEMIRDPEVTSRLGLGAINVKKRAARHFGGG